MIFTAVLTVTGVILAFIYVGHWSEVWIPTGGGFFFTIYDNIIHVYQIIIP